ncbi:MAG: hypothetical protein QXL98_02495 [Thermofilaceae archaeon]
MSTASEVVDTWLALSPRLHGCSGLAAGRKLDLRKGTKLCSRF